MKITKIDLEKQIKELTIYFRNLVNNLNINNDYDIGNYKFELYNAYENKYNVNLIDNNNKVIFRLSEYSYTKKELYHIILNSKNMIKHLFSHILKFY